MKIYLVGGAVRDRLLKLPVTERDFVVVGATPDDMLSSGFRQVGKAFPVFLHPDTQEEYALARTERKTSAGYQGFAFDFNPNVTLEEDLMRRDLTINAIAEDETGQLIDPYHGVADLQAKILRHISPAFAEDPVRLLRIARFQARFANLGFTIATETLQLLRALVVNGEVNALVAERVWQETLLALATPHPEAYFQVLIACGALPVLFPEINTPQLPHCLTLLQQAAAHNAPLIVRFALLFYEYYLTQEIEPVNTLCQRYKIPHDYTSLAQLFVRFGLIAQNSQHFTSKNTLNLLEKLDAFRRQERFLLFLHTLSLITSPTNNAAVAWLRRVFDSTKDVSIDANELLNHQGPARAQLISMKRIAVINILLRF